MKKLIILFICSIAIGQNDYSLEDINPTSDHYGGNVGTSFFEGKITINYFGYFSWGTCTARFGQLNDLYDSYKEQGLPVELIGIGKDTHISYSGNWTDNNNAPVCAEESPFLTWTDWGASQRDLFVLDQFGNVVLEQNITSGLPNNLQELIIDLLDPSVTPCELGTIFVSEVNNSGTSENYIELYNSGTVDCSLEGFRLGNSDDPLNFSFGAVVIPATGFWFDYQGQDNSFTAELDSAGDTIIFSDPNNNISSVILEPSQELDGVMMSQSFDSNGVGCYTEATPGDANAACITLSTSENIILPNKIILYQNHPNPFNPVTTMKFSLLENSYVKFDIYDLSGNLILNLIEGRLTAGISSIDWNGANHIGQKVSTGVYIYRLEIDGVAHNKKMIYLK